MADALAPRDDDALIVVDVQNDFVRGGALAVPDGDAIVPLVNRLIGAFAQVVLTQDWHPSGHASFASSHPGAKPFDVIAMPYGQQVLWPDHCVQGSHGAALVDGLAVDSAVPRAAQGNSRWRSIPIRPSSRPIGKTTTGLGALLARARRRARVRLRPRHRFLRRLQRARRARRRLRDLSSSRTPAARSTPTVRSPRRGRAWMARACDASRRPRFSAERGRERRLNRCLTSGAP